MTTLKELHDLIAWPPEQMWTEARQILLEHLDKHDPTVLN